MGRRRNKKMRRRKGKRKRGVIGQKENEGEKREWKKEGQSRNKRRRSRK